MRTVGMLVLVGAEGREGCLRETSKTVRFRARSGQDGTVADRPSNRCAMCDLSGDSLRAGGTGGVRAPRPAAYRRIVRRRDDPPEPGRKSGTRPIDLPEGPP
ncbi:hypothetical protein GCM10017667_65550 [Streptomyces filamentosus]|uniref:Uncharacterized protein n=1 Tax=Streptomyces filamentosus TaxID=67294 RepID=A0A919ERU1_STRFL|nr:hypothetical protein GCM10017667_65550 [Streptomyces filamentosus]